MNFVLVIALLYPSTRGALGSIVVPGFQTKTACEEAMRDQLRQIESRGVYTRVISSGCYSK